MYSDEDLEAAVEAGAITGQSAQALRAFVERRRAGTTVDEEHFRLLTGFNDIFVTVAILLVLAAIAWLGNLWGRDVAWAVAALLATLSWGLAEYFTRRRRMGLPSIVLLVGFVLGSVAFASVVLAKAGVGEVPGVVLGSAVAAGAAYGHWRRFHVPITVAAGTLLVLGLLVGLLLNKVPSLNGDVKWALGFAVGLAIFCFAMYWDASDRSRSTRRSDVAFWLHLAAAPLIVHPVFSLLGLVKGTASLAQASLGVALYLVLALVALVVDRRALLVSALVYVLYAVSTLLRDAVDTGASSALTALVLGSALLLLSATWHRARALLVRQLPLWAQARLPII